MSFPRYEKYKDSGVEWLGEVPNHWDIEPLKYNTYAKGRIGWQNLRSDEFIDEGPYLVTGMHFKEGNIDWNSCYHISEERYEIAPEIHLQLDDVLITKDGTIGKLAFIDYLPDRATLNSHLLVLRPFNNRYIPKFLFHALSSNSFSVYVQHNQSGTTFFGITQESIVNFPLAIPTILEQQSIATFLDRETAKIDELIAEQQQLIELLKEKRQAVISHAVTKGLNPDVAMKDSGIEWLGEVPEHWGMKRLKNISPFITVGIVVNPSEYVAEEGCPFIYGGDISEGKINTQGCRRISEYDSKKNSKTRLITGDLLTVRVGAPGITAVVTEECEGGNCASVMLIRKGNFESLWLCYAMNSQMVRFQVEVVQYGAAQEQFNISHAINFWIATPSTEEQQAIVAFLGHEITKIETLIDEASRAIELLNERRTALISATVTGKIDVRANFEKGST